MADNKSDLTPKEAMYAGYEGWNIKWNLVAIGLVSIVAIITIAKVTGTSGHVLEWLGLLVRWFHIVVGIAWIGASFYFIWLENNLERNDVPENLAGNVYSVHGGGFYYIEKYKVAPPQIPDKLHWFQWDAYLTFLSGFGLLMIVYYANAEFVMSNPNFPLPAFMTIAIGLLTLTGGWLIYDRLCKAKFAENKLMFATVGFLLVTFLALVLSYVMSGRAAYMHVGAMLGTLMAANVFFNIIPAHRVMVKAARDGAVPDPSYAHQASLRSLHNNYMTLPVIFIMIANHYPSTFGQTYNWLVLAILFLASAAVRHFLNLHERGREAKWILPVASFMVLSLALVTAPQMRSYASAAAEQVTFAEVQRIVEVRCSTCHHANPTDELFTSPPKGIVFNTAEDIIAQADSIHANSVLSNYMPLANKTGMLQEERDLIGLWVAQGAGIN